SGPPARPDHERSRTRHAPLRRGPAHGRRATPRSRLLLVTATEATAPRWNFPQERSAERLLRWPWPPCIVQHDNLSPEGTASPTCASIPETTVKQRGPIGRRGQQIGVTGVRSSEPSLSWGLEDVYLCRVCPRD